MTVVGLTHTRCVRKPCACVCGNSGGAWNPSTFFASDMLGVGQTARDRFTPERRDFCTRFDTVPTRDESCQQETTSVCVRAQEQGVCGHTYRIASSANAPPTCAHCCNQPHQSPRKFRISLRATLRISWRATLRVSWRYSGRSPA